MAPHADMKNSSPPSISRLQDGRIEKPRTRRGEAKLPNYSIDGRTFACDSCKKGHRVSKCTHALQRPVHMTNDPGRPSADQKRHCDCPRQCSCTKKNCKCERNCKCTQTMYMLVYVPVDNPCDNSWPSDGIWQIEKEVITDLKGNQLSEVEIQERNKLKSLQKNEQSPSADGTVRANTGTETLQGREIGLSLPSSSEDTSLKSCCQHRRTIQEATPIPAENDEKPPVGAPRPQCNCGTNCACAFCLEHPNNFTSQNIAKQQAAHFAEQGDFVGNSFRPNAEFGSELPSRVSCMGTNPRFAMYTNPNPTSAELLGLFGPTSPKDQGYYLSYPITGPSWPPLHSAMSPPVSSSGPPNVLAHWAPLQETPGEVLARSDVPSIMDVLNASHTPVPLLPADHLSYPGPLPQVLACRQTDMSQWGVGDASVTNTYCNVDLWSPDTHWAVSTATENWDDTVLDDGSAHQPVSNIPFSVPACSTNVFRSRPNYPLFSASRPDSNADVRPGTNVVGDPGGVMRSCCRTSRPKAVDNFAFLASFPSG